MKKTVFIIFLLLLLPFELDAQQITIRDIEFPILGKSSYGSTFGDPRSGGRTHEGEDIFAAKMTPAVAAVDGVVVSITFVEPDYGNAVVIRDADGWTYHYLHINNDTPGTDDGAGGPLYAFPATIKRGTHVTKGQLIAWTGDSGNAENVSPHLHFEIRMPDRTAIDPYPSLQAATRSGSFDPESARLRTPTINHDKSLTVIPDRQVFCVAGSLIKLYNSGTVYYCGADGKRYVFPTADVYHSWYTNFSDVTVVGEAILAQIPLGGNVTYRPGSRMVKIDTDPKTYVVDQGGVLRWVTSEEIAKSMYGSNWSSFIDDIAPTFFINYTVGEPITAPLSK